MRKSIRPVTLRRVIELSSIALRDGKTDPSTISLVLSTKSRRALEMLWELERMGLLCVKKDGSFEPTEITGLTMRAYETEDWALLHEILRSNYDFYGAFLEPLSNASLTREELKSRLSSNETLNFSETAISVLCDWTERLGQVQRNLYSGRYYLVRKDLPSFNEFLSEFKTCYKQLDCTPRPGLRLIYTEIARLREDTCERLKIKRENFDSLLIETVKRYVGKLELSGAPVTTSAKRSPSSLKVIGRGKPHPILSPTFVSLREGKGLLLDGKLYQYIAIFEPLRRRYEIG